MLLSRTAPSPRPLDARARALGALLFVMAVASGCGGQRALRQSLAKSAYRFNSDLRWARHQSAASQMSRSLSNAYLTRTEAPDDPVRVSYVQISRVIFSPKKHQAALHVLVHWHQIDQGIQRKTILIEHWRFEREAWVLRQVEHSAGPQFPWLRNLKPPRARAAAATGAARPSPRSRPSPRARP